ncbi:MAG: hypothetical protein ACLUD0_17700 [Eubacterium ramulus]
MQRKPGCDITPTPAVTNADSGNNVEMAALPVLTEQILMEQILQKTPTTENKW